MSHPLTSPEIEAGLSGLPDWQVVDDALVKTFEFKDFRAAMAFLLRMSFEAEEMNHHPEVINVYNRVRLALTTHDAGGVITEKDLKLAQRLEQL